jgi:signal transduction histidine kinase
MRILEVGTQKSNPVRSTFAPLAMLPAWYATDEGLIVQDWNDFAADLLLFFKKEYLLPDRYLSIALDPPVEKGYESLWRCILDCSAEILHLIADALRILAEHRNILDRFNQEEGNGGVGKLASDLASITGVPGVSGFAYRPSNPEYRKAELVLGVKISPAQGLPMKQRVEIGGTVVEYVDMVTAYQLAPIRRDGELIGVQFMGAQPALHDATNRHQIWVSSEERIRVENEAQVTQFLSHAFNTPLSNIESKIRELEDAALTDYYRGVRCELEANVEDLRNLSNLFLFVANAPGSVRSHFAASERGELSFQYVEPLDISDVVSKAVESILNGRTSDPRNGYKLKNLVGSGSWDADTRSIATDLSSKILDLGELAHIPRLHIVLDFTPKEPVERSITTNVKTAFLNLVVTELLVNAVKFSDPDAPEVKVECEIDSTRSYVQIHFVNNGLELKESEFKDVLGTFAMKPGEKRTALGLELNKRTARILRWDLRWQKPARKGTHLVLAIPYRD